MTCRIVKAQNVPPPINAASTAKEFYKSSSTRQIEQHYDFWQQHVVNNKSHKQGVAKNLIFVVGEGYKLGVIYCYMYYI